MPPDNRGTPEALRGLFIQTLTEKSIAIQNMRGQGCDGATKHENGSNELVDLKKSKMHCVCIIVLISTLI